MRGKKTGKPASLWEVMNKDRLRQSQEKVNDKIVHGREQKKGKRPEGNKVDHFYEGASSPTFRFSKKTFFILLGAIVLLVILFSLFKGGQADISGDVAKMPEPQEVGIYPSLDDGDIEKDVGSTQTGTADSDKDHVIVIASYNVAKDLKPVEKYFESQGIETEIVKAQGSIFYTLVTEKKYESPLRRGTDGYYALAKIKKIGSNYQAPQGYESFGKVPFQDAYGKKVKN